LRKNNIDDKLFDAMLKIAAENALEQDMEEMLSCEELNEQYQPSPDIDKRIRIVIAQHERKEKAAIWRKAAMKISVIASLIIIVSTAVLLSVEASRNYIFNAVIRWQEDHFSFEHGDNMTEQPSIEIYKPTYLPEGFEEVFASITGDINRIIYQNKNDMRITFRQYPSLSSNTLADHEEKEFTNIQINGQEAYLFVSMEVGKSNILLWEAKGIIFNISSEIESAEMILIAESIKK